MKREHFGVKSIKVTSFLLGLKTCSVIFASAKGRRSAGYFGGSLIVTIAQQPSIGWSLCRLASSAEGFKLAQIICTNGSKIGTSRAFYFSLSFQQGNTFSIFIQVGHKNKHVLNFRTKYLDTNTVDGRYPAPPGMYKTL